MDTVASADGTMIAFDRYGGGPPVILTVGAFTPGHKPSRWQERSRRGSPP